VALFLHGLTVVTKRRVPFVFLGVGSLLTGASALCTLIMALT
jgi:hypothetical protein